MQRRALLKGLAVGIPAAAGAAAAASRAYIKDKSIEIKDKGREAGTALAERLEELKNRFEESEARNRKLIKIAIGLAAISLGLDISSLL